MERLPVAVIDGFEFVSTFAPADGQAFFVLSKLRVPSMQGMSTWYLAPASPNQDCAAVATSDGGKDRAVSRRGAQPGGGRGAVRISVLIPAIAAFIPRIPVLVARGLDK